MELLDHSRGPRLRIAFVGLSVVVMTVAAGLGGAGGVIAPHAGFMLHNTAVTANASSSGAAQSTAVSAPTFFPNVKLPCSQQFSGALSGCGQQLEPEVASGPDGTIYVTAQEGVPGGVNVWRRDPGTYEYKQLYKADANEPLTSNTGLALGGGDNDLAVTTDGRVVVASLDLLSAPVSYSTDRGKTWNKVELANGLPNVDRMWLTTVGASTIYYAYHDNQISQIWLVKSTDGGATWSTPTPVIPADHLPQAASLQGNAGNVQGDMVADPDGRIVIPFLSPKDVAENVVPMGKPDSMYVAVTDTNGENPTVHTVFEGDKDIMGLFPAVASDKAGNLYATFTDKHGIFFSISRDHGVTWSAPSKISTGKGNTSTVFPYIIGGSKGRVALAWLGSSAATNDVETAKWVTYFAQTTDALAKNPTWTQTIASDHVVHAASICLNGLACEATGGNRTLAEVLQMGITKDGRVIISYPDSSSGGGWSFLAEQRFGPGMYANIKPTPPPLVVDGPGGLIRGLVKRVGPLARYFTATEAGTGLQDAEGNQVDGLGETGALSPARGSEGHVASANEFTTSLGGNSIAFDGAPLSADTIVGGNLALTAFLQEATGEGGEATSGTINARLFDVTPAGLKREIFYGELPYVAGIEATKSVYNYKILTPFEVPKGDRLRVEISTLHSQYSTTMRFYYGDATYPAGITLDTFVRASGATKPVAKPKPHVLGEQLPATGVGSSSVLAVMILAGALGIRLSLRRARG